jgi:hypothetical protein
MYLIIDNNVVHCCVKRNDPDGTAIVDWVRQTGQAVAGGGLLREYGGKNGNFDFVRLFNQLVSAGRALKWPDAEVDDRSSALKNTAYLRSNDHDIIALAQVSGARALWSRDKNLRRDFSDKALIDNPRGRMYFPEGNPKRRIAGLRAITRVCRKV